MSASPAAIEQVCSSRTPTIKMIHERQAASRGHANILTVLSPISEPPVRVTRIGPRRPRTSTRRARWQPGHLRRQTANAVERGGRSSRSRRIRGRRRARHRPSSGIAAVIRQRRMPRAITAHRRGRGRPAGRARDFPGARDRHDGRRGRMLGAVERGSRAWSAIFEEKRQAEDGPIGHVAAVGRRPVRQDVSRSPSRATGQASATRVLSPEPRHGTANVPIEGAGDHGRSGV